ncbi:hypothetical protein C475_09274 [Halosimplex carlsbadense 2-9-1]|uniref:DUF447 family protein n=1 Tax=Halosimplex carlsbadense 2-9-1 TaxID=797114 RepID=M0CSM0_9EURY|nr:DUF447 domain-containing protein [Halosimplex carlsbadense]ELZ25638.1 hypothetical protein C475_09274 [Halosimplex carlsbadense 2-9-1]
MSDDAVGGTGDGNDDGATDDWPVEIAGVVESVVTTLGPNDRWNVAALGLHAGDPVTARTYGRTRTWRNFRERGGGVVQFTRDPVGFVDAALSIHEVDEPVLDSADAWVEVEVERVGTDQEGDTEIVTWKLGAVDSGVERRVVPTTNRGFSAVVEATVAASRLDVDGFDREELLERLAYFERVVETAGGERERVAFERIRDLVDAEW